MPLGNLDDDPSVCAAFLWVAKVVVSVCAPALKRSIFFRFINENDMSFALPFANLWTYADLQL
jgi:hypothetical protein